MPMCISMHEVKCIRGSLENKFLGMVNGMMIVEKWNGGSKYVVTMNIVSPACNIV